MKIKLTIKTLCLLTTLLVVSSQAMALPCYITSRSDSGSGSQATLRKVLETNLAENATEICDSRYTPDGDNDNFSGDFYFEQAVLIDPSVSFSSGSSLRAVTLGSRLDVDLPWTAVIGNPGDSVFSDSSSDVDYTGSADNNFSSDAPQDSFYNVQYLVIDGRNLAEGTNPFDCQSGTEDLYLRNVIVLTNNVAESEVFSDCVKNAGNAFVCKSDYDSTVTPGATGWCSRTFDYEVLPFDPNWDWDDFFIFKKWYRDADGDGFGDPSDSVTTMRGDADHENGPAGYVRNDDDCDDTRASVNPDGTEVCNDIDDDCNGIIDDNATDAPTWYYDGDHDNYGDPNNSDLICDGAYEWVADNTDCDDSIRSVNPAATEICDSIDNNCDGNIDENATTEICDTLDNDCDGSIDEDDVCGTTGETDDDGDGFCEGTTCSDGSTPGDCDDTNSAVNPNATEICNTIDDNCDGNIDENATTEVCDSVDNDCDTAIDEDDVCSPDGETDDDGDGFCEGATCSDGSTPGDCNDADPAINPNATETCDSVDNDCDSAVDEDDICIDDDDNGNTDDDGDGFCEGTLCSDGSTPGDCNDANININPSAPEVCDTIDNNCDGSTDEANVCDDGDDGTDDDDDGFCERTDSCDDGSDPGDCNDANANINPSATEICDTIDNDCDTVSDEDDVCDGEGQQPNAEEECSDSIDNDGDGRVDCADISCIGTMACNIDGEGLGANPEAECSDKLDNDEDGLKDCFDPGCNGTVVCNVLGEGLGNGTDAETECSDGIDGDMDGLLDCNDPNCAGTVTCDENGEGIGSDREQTCSDDIDNDNDKMTDCLDPGCFGTIACNVSGEGLGTDDAREEACGDGIDNDIDGLTDCNEPSCHTTTVCEEPVVIVDPTPSGNTPTFGGQIQGGSCSLNPTATQGSSMTTILLMALGFLGVFNAARREEQ